MNNIGGVRRRRAEVERLVRERPVRSQDDLARLLRERGWRVTQPTLSRDVRALGLVKTPAGYALPGGPSPAPGAREASLDRALAEFARSAEVASVLVVVKTPPAGADPLARAIDEAALPGVVGTIAGDDTVFVATRSAAARRILERLAGAAAPGRRAARR